MWEKRSAQLQKKELERLFHVERGSRNPRLRGIQKTPLFGKGSVTLHYWGKRKVLKTKEKPGSMGINKAILHYGGEVGEAGISHKREATLKKCISQRGSLER